MAAEFWSLDESNGEFCREREACPEQVKSGPGRIDAMELRASFAKKESASCSASEHDVCEHDTLRQNEMLVQTKNLSFVASVQRGNFRRAKRHSFWNA